MKRAELTGMVFGTTKVLRPSDKKRKSTDLLWECQCKCGMILYETSSNLRRGRGQRCEMCRLIQSISSPVRALYGTYRRNAVKRGYEFELSLEEFHQLVVKDCEYCELPPSQTMYKEGARFSLTYTGVDRVDNSLGYIHSNVVPCCKFCNLAKSTYPVEEFRDWINRLKGQISRDSGKSLREI